MVSSEYLECEFYLTGYDQARISLLGRDYSGRPTLNEAVRCDLLQVTLDPVRYGTLLFDALLPSGRDDLLAGYLEGLAIARRQSQRMRFRLHIATTAPRELHNLHWELLYDPRHRIALARSRETAFSRCLSVATEPLPVLEARPSLLVVIATPSNLADLGLPELDGDDLWRSIEGALVPLGDLISYEILEPPITPGRLRERLLRGDFHALHLLAHGQVSRTRSSARLVLEDDDRRARFVDTDLFSEIFEGDARLRLVTLGACHGGAQPGADPFSGLGPALVERGIPAVIAMRQAISVPAFTLFTEHLYRHLADSGRVDRAANEARLQMHLSVPNSMEWGTPALFMRLAEDRLWQVAGSAGAEAVARAPNVFDAATATEQDQPTSVAATRRRRAAVGRAAAVVLAGVLLLVLFGRFAPRPLMRQPAKSVALLGFQDPSGKSQWKWLATALAELTAFHLESVDGLQVISTRELRLESGAIDDVSLDLQADVLDHILQNTPAEAAVRGSFNITQPSENAPRLGIDVWIYGVRQEGNRRVSERDRMDRLPELIDKVVTWAVAEMGHGRYELPEQPRHWNVVSWDQEAVDLYEQARANLRLRQTLEARQQLERALKLETRNPYLHAALADCLQDLGYEKEAEQAAAEALKLSSGMEPRKRWYFLGLLLQTQRQWSRASAVFKALWITADDPSTMDETRLDEGLRLAYLQVLATSLSESRDTLGLLRSAQRADDPRFWLIEAEAARLARSFETQKRLSVKAAATAKEVEAPLLLARALYLKGVALTELHETDAALETLSRAREIYKRENHLLWEGHSIRAIGSIYNSRRDWSSAIASYQDAGNCYAALGNVRFHGKQLSNQAMMHHVQGHFEPALNIYREALKQNQEAGDALAEIYTRIAIVLCQVQLGRLSEAEHELASAKRIDDRRGRYRNPKYPLRIQGELRRAQGRFPEARRDLERALELYRQEGHALGEATVSLELAMVLHYQGELAEAQAALDIALEFFGRNDASIELARARRVLGDLYHSQGELEEARRQYEIALNTQSESPNPVDTAEILASLARLLLAEGRPADAVQTAREAANEFHHSKAVLEEARARGILASALLASGQVPKAEREVAAARRLSSAAESFFYQLPIELTAARILAATGKAEDAREYLDKILAEAATSGFLILGLEAKLALGKLDIDAGRISAGIARLDAVSREAGTKGLGSIVESVDRVREATQSRDG